MIYAKGTNSVDYMYKTKNENILKISARVSNVEGSNVYLDLGIEEIETNFKQRRKIKTDYEFKEGWQYQIAYVDLDTLDIIVEQNHKLQGIITTSTDIYTKECKEYKYWWDTYGKKAVINAMKEL